MDSHTPCMNSCMFLASTIFSTEDTLNEEIVYMLPFSLVGCYLVLKICISHAIILWHTWVYISLYNLFICLFSGLESYNLFNNFFYSLILLNIFHHTLSCERQLSLHSLYWINLSAQPRKIRPSCSTSLSVPYNVDPMYSLLYWSVVHAPALLFGILSVCQLCYQLLLVPLKAEYGITFFFSKHSGSKKTVMGCSEIAKWSWSDVQTSSYHQWKIACNNHSVCIG